MSHFRLSPAAPSAFASALLLSGCVGTGLAGSSEYGCKAPDGVRCDSVSGVYANSVANNLPYQRGSQPTEKTPVVAAPNAPAMQVPSQAERRLIAGTGESAGSLAPVIVTPSPLQALRAQPQVHRLWIKPWEDSDGDLHGASEIYIQIDPGRWNVEYVPRAQREGVATPRPPRVAANATSVAPAVPSRTSRDPQRPAPDLRAVREAAGTEAAEVAAQADGDAD